MKSLLFTLALLLGSSAFGLENVTDADYYKKVSCSEGLTLVDFYADWCGACKMVHPVLEKLEKEYKGKIKFYQIDTDKSPKTSAYFSIRYIPTIFIFKNGGNPQEIQNAPEDIMREQINNAVKTLEKK